MLKHLELVPDIGVPFKKSIKHVDLRDRANAACNTAKILEELGLSLKPDTVDKELATTLVSAYAKDPGHASRAVSNMRAAELPPTTLAYVSNILDEYGRHVVQHASQIRNLVTNKLLIETEHKDGRIRLRAIELLGKLAEVGAFTEKVEVQHNHRTESDLRSSLRGKLDKLKGVTTTAIAEAEFVEL
jgi:hypothetical protein